MKRFPILVFDIVLLLALLFYFTVTVVSSEISKPNLVFIVADDYGWNDIGYHGSEIKTPVLDKLAGQGVKLENYYVQPICTPSRSQLLSGRYQIHTGLQHEIIWPCMPSALPLGHPTLADKLKESGYSTHMIGKWHIGFYKNEYVPVNRGFDTFTGYLSGSEDYYSKFRRYNSHSGIDFEVNNKHSNSSFGQYSAHFFTRQAQVIIGNHDKSKPLFLYLAFQSVHSPLQVPKKYEDLYSHISDRNRRIYAGMVSAMDEAVGNVTQSLMESGIWNNTVLVFTTDNGGQTISGGNNAPLRGRKGTYWEGGVHGVGFVSGPLLKRPGSVSRDLIHITDWYPTLVKLSQGSFNQTMLDGFNVWDTINLGFSSPRKEILHNIDPMYDRKGESISHIFDTSVQAALRYGDWKILTGDPGFDGWVPEPTSHSSDFFKEEKGGGNMSDTKNVYLFNIADDPNEYFDLSTKRPEMVEMLLKRLAAYNATAVPVNYPDDDSRCDPSRHGGFWGPWL